jgi:hypothetical protein
MVHIPKSLVASSMVAFTGLLAYQTYTTNKANEVLNECFAKAVSLPIQNLCCDSRIKEMCAREINVWESEIKLSLLGSGCVFLIFAAHRFSSKHRIK